MLEAPGLVVVSGPAGAGKTTLAHRLAHEMDCPAVCRDEIKEALVANGSEPYEPSAGDDLTTLASTIFFETLRRLLADGVTLVAEAAFQDHVWRPNLEPLSWSARLRIIRCVVDPAVGRRRVAERPERHAHPDATVLDDPSYYDRFVPLSLTAPTLDVVTSDGYAPAFDQVIAFARDS